MGLLGKKKSEKAVNSKSSQNFNFNNQTVGNNNLNQQTPDKAYNMYANQNKTNNKQKKKGKLAEKIEMYDMIIANLIAGKSVIPPQKKLGNSQVAIGFSNISSEDQISKYFMIKQLPDYMKSRMVDEIRNRCVLPGVKINFYFYGYPHKINWESPEMRNKMTIWKNYSIENSGPIDVFDYRTQRTTDLARRRIITSTRYLNEAELDYKRSLVKVAFVIEVSSSRDTESLLNMMDVIRNVKEICNKSGIVIRELRVNMIDWMQALGPFCMRAPKEVQSKMSYKILTDDILANFNSYKQGRVGYDGVSLGIDVLSNEVILRKFKADPDAPENWLISAGTGGGKSFYVKTLLTYLLADDFVVTVMDYEGDEYINMANYIRAGNPEDVKVISMGKGSTTYFDPCEIPRLTGDPEVDEDLKEQAINYIVAIFRIIASGLDGNLTQWEERVLSTAISRMYDYAGVTDDPNTWKNSKGLRLYMVYDELKEIVESKELVDSDSDNVKHRAAVRLLDAASVYFEEGAIKSGTFKNAMSADELYKAKFIVFSFGMKGAASNLNDPTILALKQLSVASVSIQISNYCKYVKHCFNVKVWEEYQRYSGVKGSEALIGNAMTGGRKRGDVNFIITNDLAAILDDDNEINKKLRQNVQNMAIGRIPDSGVRAQFCQKFDLQDCLPALDKIAKAHVSDINSKEANSGYGNRYRHSFCIIQDNGKKAVGKVMLPRSIAESTLFKTGVILKDNDRE